ncbi:unnamed protein product [Allacma fusca]|uniref:Retinoblastoma-like protein 1 n=1 Tax=Allacma fusca TaxID=39272 RepID=A0A8J2PKC8_9HEXA|nr:unnamed protein product [Allacma fusca]
MKAHFSPFKLELVKQEAMGEENVHEDEAYERFQELCSDLNLDSVTKENTWKTFTTVRSKYTLEGDIAHWLCCAVYVACRQASVPSVNSPTVHGNYVNLTRLLRTSRLSLTEFFDKSRKWGDMTNLNQEFRSKIERLERNFAVTTCIFKKFDPIFAGLFKDFSRRELEENRANRKKLSPKSASDLFEFCWTLFLCVKSSLRISDDLVNSYHLLLSCSDLIFYNVAHAGRKNLLTAQFAESAENLVDSVGEPICIIHKLCDLYDGISVEAKTIKEFWLKPKIRSMIEQGTLKGDSEALTGLIDESVFEHNSKRLEKEYEEFVLTEGDFDERMYLSELRQADFGVDQVDTQLDYLRQSMGLKAFPPLQELKHLMPQTPLTGKKYVSEKEDNLSSPISNATQTVSRLQALLSNRRPEPSPALLELLNSCSRNPVQSIHDRLQKYGQLFCQGYSLKYDNQPGLHSEFAQFRSQIGQTLYYRLLESILTAESKLRVDNSELTDLMEEENFHVSLLACSLEIVLFSYNSQRRFPWILETFKLPGYHFYKVVEVIIRAEENLCRDVVKHLSQVEEKVLEELAWKIDSPFWVALAKKNEAIPSCEEVLLPSQIEKMGGDSQAGNGESAPKRYAVIKTPSGEKCVPVAVGGTNQSTLIIQDKTSSQILGVVLPSKHGDKPKKGNSTALFLRKFYHLSYVRLQDLCKNLCVDDELLRKIWTCFQNAIVNHVEELMKSRHLDQILMCCVYVVAKVVGNEKTFTEIMRCYRLQPQSASHIYRSVPLTKEDERGDLIKFYNTIFIGRMQKYALKFSTKTDEGNNVPLSPVPHLKATPLSPCRKVSNKHSVFLRPLRAPKTPSPSKQLRYNFNRSPNSNLKAINAMVQIADNKPKVVKRLLGDDGPVADPIPSKVFARRLQEFIEDRQILE